MISYRVLWQDQFRKNKIFLSIKSEIMERFWCLRCLNNHIEVPDLIRLFAGCTTTPLVVKIWTKQPWVKIEYSRNFDRNFALFRGKIWLWLFYNFFLRYRSKFIYKKCQVIWTKNEGMTEIFRNFDFIWNGENQRHAFIFAQNYLKFFV